MSKACGCCLGLVAFAITLIIGAVVDNPLEVVLGRSLLALGAFYILGQIVGGVADGVIKAHYRKRLDELEASLDPHAQDAPQPDEDRETAAA